MPMLQQGLATIEVDNAAGTATNISVYVTAYEGPTTDKMTEEWWSLASLDAEVSEGGKSGGLSLTVVEAPNSHHGMLVNWHEGGGERTITISKPSTANGGIEYTAEYVPTGSVTYSRGQGGSRAPTTATFTYRRVGDLTVALIA